MKVFKVVLKTSLGTGTLIEMIPGDSFSFLDNYLIIIKDGSNIFCSPTSCVLFIQEVQEH